MVYFYRNGVEVGDESVGHNKAAKIIHVSNFPGCCNILFIAFIKHFHFTSFCWTSARSTGTMYTAYSLNTHQ